MMHKRRILVLAGMHRSGTSLVSGWLHACGLDLGDSFFEPTYGNPLGHFEDLDFVGFHKHMLKKQGLDFVLSPDQRIATDTQDLKEAYALLQTKSDRLQWGWKDPRTTLFLDFWKSRLMDIRVLGLYRSPAAVVASLLRRDQKQPATGLKKTILPIWHSPKNRWLAKRYLGTWIRYNTSLLGYADAHPDAVVLLRTDLLLQDAAAVWEKLTRQWGFHLEQVPLASIYDEVLMVHNESAIRFPKDLLQRAEELFEQLEAHRQRSLGPVQGGSVSTAG
jgi:hypothetical protein